jgi:hypothetical protein
MSFPTHSTTAFGGGGKSGLAATVVEFNKQDNKTKVREILNEMLKLDLRFVFEIRVFIYFFM